MFLINTSLFDPREKAEFNPFELVVIYAEDAYNRDNMHFDADEINVMPAFMYPAIQESNRCKLLAKNIKVGGGLVLIGVSMGLTGGTTAPLSTILGFADAISATYVMCTTEGSLLTDIASTYGQNSWQFEMADATNKFFEVYLLARTGHAAYSSLRFLGIKFGKYTAQQVEWFASKYPTLYAKMKKLHDAVKLKFGLGGVNTGEIVVQRVGNNNYNAVETPISSIRKLHGAPKKGKPINYIDQLADDILINGFRLDQLPIEGVKMSDGQILIFDGHHRLAALEKLGQTTIPIRIHNFNEIPNESMRLMLKIGEESGFYLPFQYPSGYVIPDLGSSLNSEIDLQAINFILENF